MDLKMSYCQMVVQLKGFDNIAYTFTNLNLQYQSNSNKQCDHLLHVKMFDNENTPKYIIGSDYKVIPVNKATTDVLVSECSLAPVVSISQ